MDFFLKQVLPGLGTFVASVIVLWAANRYLRRQVENEENTLVSADEGHRFRSQAIMIGLTFLALFIFIFALPLSPETQGDLLQFLGIGISATIALASTTILGNGMAGLMLRAIGNFRIDDYLTVGDHTGRVTERGLFHTEIQTEDQTLTTLPNMYLVTNAVTTVRSRGTLIATSLSLGYDVPRRRIQEKLLDAAKTAGLDEASISVRILSLGDFSVTYRVAGRTKETKKLLELRSNLNAAVLDELHGDGIEIVSPTFMNQRVHPPDTQFIPAMARKPEALAAGASPDATAYDKAESAATLEQLQTKHKDTCDAIDEQEKLLKEVDEVSREKQERTLAVLQSRKEALERAIAARAEAVTKGD